MTVSIGGSPFVSWTGRAVSVRRGDAAGGLPDMFREADAGRATILIASPDCWSSPGLVTATIVVGGYRVVLSPTFADITYNTLINMGILPVVVDPETIAKLQDTVESDPGIVLTVDVRSGEVRAPRELLARFPIGEKQRSRPAELADTSASRAHGGETLAGRLLLAQRLLCSARLSGDDRIRWQRRLVAICDAMKAPGADAARSARRLDRLLSELVRSSSASRPEAPGSRAQTPVSPAAASDLPAQRVGTSRARRRP
jgi:hypothetical protein